MQRSPHSLPILFTDEIIPKSEFFAYISHTKNFQSWESSFEAKKKNPTHTKKIKKEINKTKQREIKIVVHYYIISRCPILTVSPLV